MINGIQHLSLDPAWMLEAYRRLGNQFHEVDPCENLAQLPPAVAAGNGRGLDGLKRRLFLLAARGEDGQDAFAPVAARDTSRSRG